MTSDPQATLRRAIASAERNGGRSAVLPLGAARRLRAALERQARDIGQLEARLRREGEALSLTGRIPRGDERGLVNLEVRTDADGVVLDRTYARFPQGIQADAMTLTTNYLTALVALVERGGRPVSNGDRDA